MANAAAKKAAAAKSSTAGIYKPLLLGSNALYALILFMWTQPIWTISFVLGMVVTWGLQVYAYLGILDQAANLNVTGGSSKKKGAGGGSKNDLVGGVNLDILALTLVVQYGTALHSPKWYWLLIIVPIWGAYWLYTTYYGNNKSSQNKNAAEEEEVSEEVKNRRQQRAERRRQKRV